MSQRPKEAVVVELQRPRCRACDGTGQQLDVLTWIVCTACGGAKVAPAARSPRGPR